jgi:hypothetical protein
MGSHHVLGQDLKRRYHSGLRWGGYHVKAQKQQNTCRNETFPLHCDKHTCAFHCGGGEHLSKIVKPVMHRTRVQCGGVFKGLIAGAKT